MDDADAMRLVERTVADINAKRRPDLKIQIIEAVGDEFVLAIPHEDLPEGQCMDERFSEIQWILHEQDVDAGIHGGEFDEDAGAYRVRYKLIHWD